jgi:hypothetical protein
MADSAALRSRRSRAHAAGDHSLCHLCADGAQRVPSGLGWPPHASPCPGVSCWICGNPMVSHGAKRPTCARCRREHGNGVCSKCGGPKRADTPGMCRTCEPRLKRETFTCVVPGCGKIFTAIRRPDRPVPRCCSKGCAQWLRVHPDLKGSYSGPPADRATAQKAKARARRLRHAETWDGVPDEVIFERDGWRCRVPQCRERTRRISQKAKYPDRRSASIDHVVPLSEGGGDTAPNKRASHLGCNLARGNRGGMDQLAMIG